MLREISLCSALALPLAACGSTDDDAERLAADDDEAVLDACGLPVPCEEIKDLVHPGDPSCAWSELANGAPLHVTRRLIFDGPGDCRARTEIYASSSGQAIVWQFTDGADCDASYTLESCTLKPPEFFATCVAEAPASSSGSPCHYDWFENCAPIDEPACP